MSLHIVEGIIGSDRTSLGIVDVPDGQQNVEQFCRRALNFTAGNAVAITRLTLERGTYYPRMARPTYPLRDAVGVSPKGPLYLYGENRSHTLPHDRNSLAESLNQLHISIKSLQDIFEFISPDAHNMSCFGQRTRNILLLSAMEFENECKGVLRAHNVVKDKYSTGDFIKLKGPLRLEEYSIKLPHYPQIPALEPFQGWINSRPTRSLGWYDAYNAVKHDREAEFARATLNNAIEAVGAVVIMLCAQYRIIENWSDKIGHFFEFSEFPKWNAWDYVHLGTPMTPLVHPL